MLGACSPSVPCWRSGRTIARWSTALIGDIAAMRRPLPPSWSEAISSASASPKASPDAIAISSIRRALVIPAIGTARG